MNNLAQLFIPQGLDGIDPGSFHGGNAAGSERDQSKEHGHRRHCHRVISLEAEQERAGDF